MYQSILFVPANRPELIPKAMAAGASAVCVDLEDAVPPDQKIEARKIISTLPFKSPKNVAQCLRINALTTKDGILDIAAISESAIKPDVLVLPKVTNAIELSIVAAACGDDIPVIAIIESTAGLNAVHEIAAHPLTKALLFGSADFSAEIGSAMEWDALLYARSKIINAAATNGKRALDGIWPDFHDTDGLIENSRRLKAIGFCGRVAIHPKQVPGINLGFAPTTSELAFARAVIKAFEEAGGNAVQVNGKMVDRPIYDMAIFLVKQCTNLNG
jgi:citrate lyase subunit beta/citryl-CoA lyase/(S)-citramalyl-CoA lyase